MKKGERNERRKATKEILSIEFFVDITRDYWTRRKYTGREEVSIFFFFVNFVSSTRNSVSRKENLGYVESGVLI